MALDPSISLNVRPAQIESPLEQYGKVLSLRNAITQGQLQQQQLQMAPLQQQAMQQENQQRQLQLDQTNALNEAYRGALTIGPDGTADIDTGKLGQALSQAGHGSAIPGVLKGVQEFKTGAANLAKINSEVGEKQANLGGSLGATVAAANNDPNLFVSLATHAIQVKSVDPQLAGGYVQHVQQLLAQDPTGEAARQAVGQITSHLIAGSPEQQKLINEKATADARAKQAQTGADKFAAEKPGIQSENTIKQQTAAGTAPIQPTQAAEIAGQAAARAETARHNKVDEGQGAGRLSVEKQRETREQGIYDQTFGPGSNESLRGVEPKLRTQAAAAALKASDAYIKTNRAADEMERFISLARQGNKAAYASMPVAGVMEIVTPNGVTRVNRQELDAYKSAGSFFDKMAGMVGKTFTGGSIPKGVLDDIEKLHQGLRADSQSAAEAKMDAVNQTYHANFKLPKTAAPATTTSSIPTAVQQVLSKAGPGIHQLSDGSTWVKGADGSISKQ